MQELVVSPEESGQRLDKYLRRRLPLAPSSFIYKMLRKKNITLQGKKADGSEKVATDDLIRLYLSDETILKFAGAPEQGQVRREAEQELDAFRKLQPLLGPSPILYEDDNILVVRKPAGVLSQKAKDSDVSMNEWLRGYLAGQDAHTKAHKAAGKEAYKEGGGKDIAAGMPVFRPSVCNRLDRNTGGILLCAKTLPGSRALSAVIRDRVIRKTYTMLVHGQVREPGIIENELIKDRESNRVRIAGKPAGDITGQQEQVRRAVTHFRPVLTGRRVTMVEADLITGRSHQLRVHMASIGHPIVSDPKYGDPSLDRALAPGRRRGQLLWCSEVAFPESFGNLSDAGAAKEAAGVLAPAAGRVFRCPPPRWWEDLCRETGQPAPVSGRAEFTKKRG